MLEETKSFFGKNGLKKRQRYTVKESRNARIPY